jgi:hypothetical protein
MSQVHHNAQGHSYDENILTYHYICSSFHCLSVCQCLMLSVTACYLKNVEGYRRMDMH